MFKYFYLACGIILACVSYNGWAALTDPTRPIDYDVAQTLASLGKRIDLEAIFYSANNQRAIINGQTLHEGDSIAGFKLLQIKPQAVALTGPSGIFTLPLVNVAIKQIAMNGADTQ